MEIMFGIIFAIWNHRVFGIIFHVTLGCGKIMSYYAQTSGFEPPISRRPSFSKIAFPHNVRGQF